MVRTARGLEWRLAGAVSCRVIIALESSPNMVRSGAGLKLWQVIAGEAAAMRMFHGLRWKAGRDSISSTDGYSGSDIVPPSPPQPFTYPLDPSLYSDQGAEYGGEYSRRKRLAEGNRRQYVPGRRLVLDSRRLASQTAFPLLIRRVFLASSRWPHWEHRHLPGLRRNRWRHRRSRRVLERPRWRQQGAGRFFGRRSCRRAHHRPREGVI